MKDTASGYEIEQLLGPRETVECEVSVLRVKACNRRLGGGCLGSKLGMSRARTPSASEKSE